MNKILLTLILMALRPVTLAETDEFVENLLSTNVTRSPRSPPHYGHIVNINNTESTNVYRPFYNPDNRNVVAKYADSAGDLLNIMVPVKASMNAAHEFDRRTSITNTMDDHKIVYGITTTTDKYVMDFNARNVNNRAGDKSLRNYDEYVLFNTRFKLGDENVNNSYRFKASGNRLNEAKNGSQDTKMCKNGCISNWRPFYENRQHGNRQKTSDNFNAYNTTADYSALVRLKSYMSYKEHEDNPVKGLWTHQNAYTNQSYLTGKHLESVDDKKIRVPTNRNNYYTTDKNEFIGRYYENKGSSYSDLHDNTRVYRPLRTNSDQKDHRIQQPTDEAFRLHQKNRGVVPHDSSAVGYRFGPGSQAGPQTKDIKTDYYEGRELYPDKSYRYVNDGYNRWRQRSHFGEKFGDVHGWSHLKDLYFCRKYCHCCNRHKHFKGLHGHFGALGKIFHLLKYFGLDSGYDFLYGRSSQNDYNPLVYFKNLYRRFGDYDSDYEGHYGLGDLGYDESFVFFDHDHGEPDHVTDCKELCSCCHSNVIVKLKKNLRGVKKGHKRKRKLKGLINLIRHLMFDNDDDDDDDDYDFDKRSLSDRYDSGGFFDHDETEYKPNYDSHDYGWHHTDHILENDQEIHDIDVDSSHDLAHYHYDHDLKDYHHHHHYKSHVFDCSKCCRFCKKTTVKVVKGHGKKKRRKRHRKRLRSKGVLDFFRHLLRGKIPGYSFDNDEENEVNEIVTLDHHGWRGSKSPCCNDLSGVKVIVVVVVVAVIVIQSFSSVNILIVVIIPIVFFGLIIILIFLLVQAIVPIYFIPIIFIAFIIIFAPIILIAIFAFILLPIILLPIFYPFVLRMSETIPYSLPNITCSTLENLPVNCSVEPDDQTTEAYETSTFIFGNESISENGVESTEATMNGEGQAKMPKSIYWKINKVLISQFCLERFGCHMAVYTNWIYSYNRFILRILENLSQTIGQSKFVSYKDAYQIGSSNVTDHKKCAALYLCKPLDSLKIKE